MALALACLFAAAPAHARVATKEVRQSASSIAGHWTPARMRAATPADRTADGAKAKAAPAQAAWTSSEVATPYTQQPTSTHGKVFFTLGGVDYVCSGTALLSSNRSVVWTASTKAPETSPPTGSSCPPTRTAARRSASTSPTIW